MAVDDAIRAMLALFVAWRIRCAPCGPVAVGTAWRSLARMMLARYGKRVSLDIQQCFSFVVRARSCGFKR